MKKPRICDAAGCNDIVVARNLCSKHYGQLRRGVALQRRGETVPRATEREPWAYEGNEDALAKQYGEGRTANV
jgi:hypothetical protein